MSLYSIAVGGAISGGRAVGRSELYDANAVDRVPAALRQRLEDPVLRVSLWVRTTLLLGIVFLMTVRPSWGGAQVARSEP